MAKVRGRVLNHPNVFHPELSPGLEWTRYLAQKLGRMPALGGNAVEIMVDYDAILARLVAGIDQARNHVHLLYYIFADGTATAAVIAALGRAAGCGVACQVLVDALGYRTRLAHPFGAPAPKTGGLLKALFSAHPLFVTASFLAAVVISGAFNSTALLGLSMLALLIYLPIRFVRVAGWRTAA